ncbi:MAG: hypothetical protein AB7S69_03560 [Salinivirgaceae bacterium]
MLSELQKWNAEKRGFKLIFTDQICVNQFFQRYPRSIPFNLKADGLNLLLFRQLLSISFNLSVFGLNLVHFRPSLFHSLISPIHFSPVNYIYAKFGIKNKKVNLSGRTENQLRKIYNQITNRLPKNGNGIETIT